ncbi:MAG: hypothetical protein K2P66_07295 [Lachnospiraceae bacterium]|nr:hypothetical protein [Lachnospiraceae bacterium]
MNKKNYPSYQVIDSVDLRPFDNRKKDFGVGDYVETLGFVPQIITLLENSIEQIHSHNGVIDNERIPYLWCAERAMPGGNVWSKRDLYGLVESVHAYGSKFFMGALACPNQFAEYDTRAEWLYQHSDVFDLFIRMKDGSSTADTNGHINPLRRLPDGRFYEDVFIEETLRYLEDYDMDGFYGGDGWAGLLVPLTDGDFHPDMIAQFEEFSGIEVEGATTVQQAEFILNSKENHRRWIEFYANRWSSFYKKIHEAFHRQGKEFMVIDPWARGPVDALYDFGFDYKRVAPYLDGLCLEAREQNWGHRTGEWLYVWETGERVNIPCIRAQAPDLKLYWSACICNAPEHWVVSRDTINVIERESLSLPTLSYVNDKGDYCRALEGLHLIFGTDLTKEEWRFLDQRWDLAYNLSLDKVFGPAIVWSDAVEQYHLDRMERWEITAAVQQMNYAGAPVHTAVNSRNLAAASCDAYLLVDPLGITDEEVEALLQKQKEGAGLIVMGRVEHPKLLEALGIRHADTGNAAGVEYNAKAAEGIGLMKEAPYLKADHRDVGDFIAEDAEVICSLKTKLGDRVLLSYKKDEGNGPAAFIRRRNCWPDTPCRGRYFKDYAHFVSECPDEMDKLMSDLIAKASSAPFTVDKGQLYLIGTENGYTHIGMGNMGNIFSQITTVCSKDRIVHFDDYDFKRNMSSGYILYDTQPHRIQVKVPMDGAITLKIKCREDGIFEEK